VGPATDAVTGKISATLGETARRAAIISSTRAGLPDLASELLPIIPVHFASDEVDAAARETSSMLLFGRRRHPRGRAALAPV
jgi:hypothetical protein